MSENKKPVAVTVKMSWGEVMVLVIKVALCTFLFVALVAIVTALVLSLLAPAVGNIFSGMTP